MNNTNLIEIIGRLIEIENYAFETYRHAIGFDGNENTDTLLSHLADDEAFHSHVMNSAKVFVVQSEKEYFTSCIFDDETILRVTNPLIEIRKLKDEGMLTMEDLLQRTVISECSEWNDLFLYVINLLKKDNPTFEYTAEKIEHHKEQLLAFIKRYNPEHDLIKQLEAITKLVEKRILVVEDQEPFMKLLVAIIGGQAQVDTACDGLEGLELLSNGYYDLCISDIAMPQMNGISMYKHAITRIPDLASRFIFYSSFENPEDQKWMDEQNIKWLVKPASVTAIKELISEILCSAKPE